MPAGSGLYPYFPLCVDPSKLPTDTGGRETYLNIRIPPQRGTCIVSFSCPTSLPSIHHDDKRGAWAKAEPVHYVTRSECGPCNGLLNVGRASRAQLPVSVRICVLPLWCHRLSGTLISYQNGRGSDPRPNSLSHLFFALLYTHLYFNTTKSWLKPVVWTSHRAHIVSRVWNLGLPALFLLLIVHRTPRVKRMNQSTILPRSSSIVPAFP